MITLTDQLQTNHSFAQTPKRIVSLVPSQTELLFDLGLEESIVGITKFCVHPNHFLKSKKIVGGTKNPNYKSIIALNPDVIICNKEENTKEIVDLCSEICTVWVTDIVTIEDNYRMICDFGNIFDKIIEAKNLSQKIEIAISDFKIFIKEKSVLKVAYFIWKNPYMVAGSCTFIDELLQLNNFENVFQSQNRYPEIDIKNLKNINLDLILLSSEPYPFEESDQVEFLKLSPNLKIMIVDGEMFSWHGSRVLKSINYFKIVHQNYYYTT